MDWSEELQLAKGAALAAGALLSDRLNVAKTVLKEEGRDIKLQADRDAEAVILNILSESSYNVLAEESGEHGDLTGDAPFWIVDPLDGTMNFSRGIPLCCVSIALCQGENPVLGVVYDFNRDECFTGIVGEGAWLNDDPMRVSVIKEAAKGILTTGFPVRFSFEDEESFREYMEAARRFKKVRLIGTAALAAAWVACGRVDAYGENNVMFWDVAAGVALIKAAGGMCELKPGDASKWACRIRAASNETIWTT